MRFKCLLAVKCCQKLCCTEAWCTLLCSGHGWTRRLRMQKWRSAWSLPPRHTTAPSDCLQVKLWGCMLCVISSRTQGFIFKSFTSSQWCEWFIPVWVGGICRIKTGLGMFPITGLSIRRPAPAPLRLSRPLLPPAYFFPLTWNGLGRDFSQTSLIFRTIFAARCCTSATRDWCTRVGEKGTRSPPLLGTVTHHGVM